MAEVGVLERRKESGKDYGKWRDAKCALAGSELRVQRADGKGRSIPTIGTRPEREMEDRGIYSAHPYFLNAAHRAMPMPATHAPI